MVRPQSVLRAFLATRRSHRPRLQVGGEPEKSVSVGGAVERVGRIEHPNVAPDQEVLREQETSKARESRRPPQQNANNCNQRPPGATARPARSCFGCFAACFARSLLCCFAALAALAASLLLLLSLPFESSIAPCVVQYKIYASGNQALLCDCGLPGWTETSPVRFCKGCGGKDLCRHIKRRSNCHECR